MQLSSLMNAQIYRSTLSRCAAERLEYKILDGLAEFDPRKAKVVEMRFFGGLSVEETAAVLKISPQSVMRDWKLAKAWLRREIRHDKGRLPG